MAERRREVQTGSGVTITNEIRRGRVNQDEINRIKADGNTQLLTAAQQGHKASLGDRLNGVLNSIAAVAPKVKAGVWGIEQEEPVHEDLLTENERRMLETADEGTVIKETVLRGVAPYQIRELGDGRTVITVQVDEFKTIVGVGSSLEGAVEDLEGQVKK